MKTRKSKKTATCKHCWCNLAPVMTRNQWVADYVAWSELGPHELVSAIHWCCKCKTPHPQEVAFVIGENDTTSIQRPTKIKHIRKRRKVIYGA